MASALEKDDEATSKGAKAKEDADRGAACSDHCHDESTSREMSPQQSPSNLRTRECFALLFGVEVTPTIEDGVGSHILPTYVWSERIIFDMLSPTIEDISQVVILNPMECLIFRGCHSKGEGFTYGDALALRPCPMPITGKQPHGLAKESRCTASCAPYEMPEKILGWSGTRNMTRPSSAYGNSTRKVRKVDHRHQAVGREYMCHVHGPISPMPLSTTHPSV